MANSLFLTGPETDAGITNACPKERQGTTRNVSHAPILPTELRRLFADLVTAISTSNRIEVRYSYSTVCLPHALYNEPDCSSMEVPGIYGCAGLSDIVFMFSRDGITFTHFREAFIRPGRDIRNWHGRAIEVGPTLVPTGDGEMSLYFVENYGTQTVKIRRGVLREDGFVSLQGNFEGGSVRTRPFRFSGSRLTLNYSTSAAGSLRVEIQDQRGDPLEGFGLDDCKLIFGDELQRTVTWKGGSDLSALAGQTVRMKIEIRDGDLFSLQFH